jgi:very-short-patch-repair endonuclease
VVASRGGRSWLELRFFADAGLVVEVLGYRWHRTELQMSRDAERANRLMLDGQRMLQFTHSTIAGHPERVMVDLYEALVGPVERSA